MLRLPDQPQQRPPKPQHYLAKSTSVSSVLYGGPNGQGQPCSNHFVDSLERFKKDYAVYGKEERAQQREKRMRILEERKNEQIERDNRVKRNQLEYDQTKMDKVNQSRYLCEIGVKKTGFSNGLPMNPITLQYHKSQGGTNQQYLDEEHKLKNMVRAHHIQHASTSGYNPINGSNLPSIAPLIPKNTEGRFEAKVGQFYQTKKLDPNVDLGLNHKKTLPRHVGEVDHGSSPIKRQTWEEDDNIFQSSYKTQFNTRPHEEMGQSRMQQSQEIQKMIEDSRNKGYYKPQVHQHRYVNNENENPILQDSVYRSQVSGSKSRASQKQLQGRRNEEFVQGPEMNRQHIEEQQGRQQHFYGQNGQKFEQYQGGQSTYVPQNYSQQQNLYYQGPGVDQGQGPYQG